MVDIKRLCDCIIQSRCDIYLHNYDELEYFLKPKKYYCKFNQYRYSYAFIGHCDINNNILFYLTYKNYEKYDLINKVIDYGLFDKIDVNKQHLFRIVWEDGYRDKIDNYYMNMLTFSCLFSDRFSSVKIAKTLLENPNFDVNYENCSGKTILMNVSSLTEFCKKEILNLLLEHPNINVNIINKSGETALMIATKYLKKHPYKVLLLLKHPNIDIDIKDKNGWTALSLSIYHYKKRNLDVMKEIWMSFGKCRTKQNMFSLYEKKKGSSNKGYIYGLKEYMKFERFNLINHRRFYRNQILNKGY
jgi:hypothetical protein